MIRALMVEDHATMRFGVKTFLEASGEVEVVGEADYAEEALRLAEELELVILDLRLRGEGGIELCREIKSLPEPPYVLVYTAPQYHSGKIAR
jgi:two-component system response regulator DevR